MSNMTLTPAQIDFIRESNRIEPDIGDREPLLIEKDAFEFFLLQNDITVNILQQFVFSYSPGAVLRDKPGLNVCIGSYIPPGGGPEILKCLKLLLDDIHQNNIDPYQAHIRYETLHPFTDGNGRSGRALWYWHMTKTSHTMHEYLGFLHSWYYQSLQKAAKRFN